MSSSTQEINVKLFDGYHIADGYDLADGYLLVSNPVKIRSSKYVSVNYLFANSPTGTLKIQATDEGDDPSSPRYMAPGLNGNGGTLWTDVTGSSTSISANGTGIVQLATIIARYIRVVYTDTGGVGAGTITLWVSAKE